MNDIGNWGGGGAQDFWPTHTSSMPIWILSAESPRSRDISSSTNYFSFSFIYFILLSKQYRFLILSTALQSQMPTHYQQLPHSCDIALFLNRKFINILGEGKKGRKKKKKLRHSPQPSHYCWCQMFTILEPGPHTQAAFRVGGRRTPFGCLYFAFCFLSI